MSCYFYWYSSGSMIVLLFYSLIMDFYLGKLIYDTKDSKKRKFYFIVSLIGNLGLLFIFKYTNFLTEVFNYFMSLFHGTFFLPNPHILLPIGISFYTFCSLSYTFDIYRKELKPIDSLVKYAFFITFFPHLVAGPILRASRFLPQLRKKIRIIPKNFRDGLTNTVWGLVKKVVFADNVAVFTNAYFSDPTVYSSSVPVFFGALAFGIQIYCDFSGYSQMAIGLAQMMGITLPINFNKPYAARNASEFWNRWHISLSSWLKDYLYIPLGGNRKGKIRTYVNVLLTMIIGGLWHGASWNFLFWGLYQGILLMVHKVSEALHITALFDHLRGFGVFLGWAITQFFVFLGWIIFRVYDINVLFFCMKKFIFWDFTGSWTEFLTLFDKYNVPLLFLFGFIVIHVFTFFKGASLEKALQKDMFYWVLYLFIACLALYFLAPAQTVRFIYFQF